MTTSLGTGGVGCGMKTRCFGTVALIRSAWIAVVRSGVCLRAAFACGVGVATLAQADCGVLSLTQSTNPSLVGVNSVWCGSGAISAETQLARVFTAPYDLTLKCVTFGVSQNTGGDWPCHVRILKGAINTPYASLQLLTQTTVNIPAGTTNQLFTANIPALLLPNATSFIVELSTPTRDPAMGGDGKLLALGFNPLGQNAPSYLRGVPCGVNQFQNLASLGFGDRHLVMSLGVDQGMVAPLLGGWPIGPIGPVTLSELNGEVAALGDGGPGLVGLSIDYGSMTMGAGATFRALSTGNESGAMVSLEFKGRKTDRLILTDAPVNPNAAVLQLDFKQPGFEQFDVRVYNDGVLVGTIPNQSSGSVTLTGMGPLKWHKSVLGAKADVQCHFVKEYDSSGALTLEAMSYGASIGTATLAPVAGGSGYVGNEFKLIPTVPMVYDPPAGVNIVSSGIPGVAVNIHDNAPSVRIGDVETELSLEGSGWTTNVGTQFSMHHAIVRMLTRGKAQMVAKDVTSDRVPDLVFLPPATQLPPADGDGVFMNLAGALSASIGMSVVLPSAKAALLMHATGPAGQYGGSIQLAPWSISPSLIAVKPDFAGLGNGSYTLQAFDPAGVLIFEQNTMVGIAGGSSHWPASGGRFGTESSCFRLSYPTGTQFHVANGGPIIAVSEIRMMAEQAGPASPIDTIQIAATNMGELRLFDPVVELPAFGACYADCDGDATLTIDDFICFQTLFALNDPYADCDADGVQTIDDFICFQTLFAIGC